MFYNQIQILLIIIKTTISFSDESTNKFIKLDKYVHDMQKSYNFCQLII